MSRPSYLYFRLPQSDAKAQVLGESYCDWEDMPSLWRLLISQGKFVGVLPPISGENGPSTQTMQVPARQAIDRLVFFNAYIQGHPLLHLNPSLPVFLDAVLSFMRERLSVFLEGELDRVLLVVQLGSDRWHEDMAEVLEELDTARRQLDVMSSEQRYEALDDLLGFARLRHGFKQWRAWSHLFGLETLTHPYFTRLEYSGYWTHYHEAPAARAYQDFAQNSDKASGEDEGRGKNPGEKLWSPFVYVLHVLLGALVVLYRFAKRRLPGSRRSEDIDDDAECADEEPDEEEEQDDDEGDTFDTWRHTGYFPEYVDGKVGLCVLDRVGEEYHRGARALALEWDEIAFPNGSTAWGRRAGKWTLIGLAPTCTLIFDACCDEILKYDYARTTCIVKQNGRYGLVDSYRSRWLAHAEYEDIKCEDDSGTSFWRVRRDKFWGLLDESGVVIQPCIFDRMEADIRGYPYTELGWQVVQGRRMGWITRDGAWEVACEWDDIQCSLALGLYAVARESRWGLVARGDVLWIPCQYLSVEPVALMPHFGIPSAHHVFLEDSIWPDDSVAAFIATHDPSQAQVLIVVSTENGTGVVDQANREIVPCTYQSVAPPQSDNYQDSRWFCLVDRDGRHGLWSVELDAEIFRCEHEWLEMIVWPGLRKPWVGTVAQERYQLWNIDGTAVFDGEFRWLKADTYNSDYSITEGLGRHRTGNIAKAWTAGKEVRAAMVVEGNPDQMMLLLPGQPMRPEHESLLQAYRERGDIEAALTLSEYCLNGFHMPKDPSLARIWAARACGHEMPPVAQSVNDSPRVSEHSKEATDALRKLKIEACCRFAQMLYDGEGGPRDTPLARHWAETAFSFKGNSSESTTMVLLAKLLLDSSAGPVDPARAYQLLEDIDALSWDEGEACYYRATILRDGIGKEQDVLAARELFRRSDSAGMAPAASALAELLRAMAKTATREEEALLLREAAYYEQKAKWATGNIDSEEE
jgi:hypothetical protein